MGDAEASAVDSVVRNRKTRYTHAGGAPRKINRWAKSRPRSRATKIKDENAVLNGEAALLE